MTKQAGAPVLPGRVRRIVRGVLLVAVGLVTLPVVAFVALSIYTSIPKTDTFYLPNADFADANYLDKLQYQLEATGGSYRSFLSGSSTYYAHRIGPGRSTILALRWYSAGTAAIDDESFEKLTISAPALREHKHYEFKVEPSTEVQALYSKGGSAWPTNVCTWKLAGGQLEIDATSEQYVVHISGNLVPGVKSGWPEWCGKLQTLDRTFNAYPTELAKLTPWLGRPGNHPYDESYRPHSGT
jgi:hypothetical protein